jgi:2Fe-2S ferredoxin
MPHIIFIQPDGSVQEVPAVSGESVMQAAINALVPGIVADCGGACTCATCHAYVDGNWIDKVPRALEGEREMVDDGCLHALPESRLTCQITMTDELDGLVMRLPPE